MKDFYKALEESFSNYKKHGARSNKKLKPIHSWIGREIKKRLGESYSIMWLDNPKEYQINGAYLPKFIDVAILKNDKPKVMISFKFVTSNYSQNNVNYFENLIGECANIKMADVNFGHILTLRDEMPYFKKDGSVKHTEKITDKNLHKYIKLAKDFKTKHAPDVMAIIMVSVNNDTGEVKPSNLNNLEISKESKEFLKLSNMDNFIRNIVKLAESQDYP